MSSKSSTGRNVMTTRNSSTDGQGGRPSSVIRRVLRNIVLRKLEHEVSRLRWEDELEARLHAENREVARVDEEKSRSLLTLTHELKTPLTTILAFSDILLQDREKNLSTEQLEHLKIMRQNGHRLHALINDLLVVFRVERGALTLDINRFDVTPLLNEIVESFAPTLKGKDQVLQTSISTAELWISGDRARIAQVVSNLLSNASKYSPAHTVIELHASEREGKLRVTVRDHGIGISDAEQERLFIPFLRPDDEATRAVPGAGLGLAIARSLVDLHGGGVELESEPGLGTAVTFTLPGAESPPNAGSGATAGTRSTRR